MMIVDHFLDRSASLSSTKNDWLETWGAVVPGIVANVLPFYGPVRDAVAHVPGALQLLRMLVPVLSIATCFYAVISRKALRSPLGPLNAGTGFSYRFSNPLRQISKIALMFLVPIAVFEVIDNMPRNILSAGVIDGYLCSASNGKPIAEALVQAYDTVDQLVSIAPSITDSDGYFALTLSRGSARPRELRTEGKCGALKFDAAVKKRSKNGCPTPPTPPPDRGEVGIWIASCPVN
jgi:hypothetical protein